jgi:hypothetical protein
VDRSGVRDLRSYDLSASYPLAFRANYKFASRLEQIIGMQRGSSSRMEFTCCRLFRRCCSWRSKVIRGNQGNVPYISHRAPMVSVGVPKASRGNKDNAPYISHRAPTVSAFVGCQGSDGEISAKSARYCSAAAEDNALARTASQRIRTQHYHGVLGADGSV